MAVLITSLIILLAAGISDALRYSVPVWLIALLALTGAAGLVLKALDGHGTVVWSCLGFAAASCLFIAIGVVARDGFGPADVAVASLVALSLDWTAYITAMLVACACGIAVHGIAGRRVAGETAHTEVPIPFVACSFLGYFAVAAPYLIVGVM